MLRGNSEIQFIVIHLFIYLHRKDVKMQILDFIAKQAKTLYLSDLKINVNWKSVIESISPEDFPLKEWNNAVSYLTGDTTVFQSPQEARTFLLTYDSANI